MRRRDVVALLGLIPMAVVTAVPALAFGESDVTDALSAMMSAGSRTAQVRQLRNVPGVGIVDLRFQRNSRLSERLLDVSEFRISAQKNARGITRLRRALAGNPVTREALASHGIDIGHVVGVKISSGGSLRVYVL